ncbi:MAG: hypothetical protein O6945_09180, partial [Gammaproteobacteria bacterium]|nr:hypothetical protein [Gammaproteobacteria bacterium]
MNDQPRFQPGNRRQLLRRTLLLSMLLIVCQSKTILASASERGDPSRQIFREMTETYIDRSYGF